MTHKISFIAFIVVLIGVSCSFYGFNDQNKTMHQFPTNDYEAAWRVIDSLQNEGLPKSALEKVEVLYTRAKKEKNPSQIIKTVLYKGKYTHQLEEDGFSKAIKQLQTEMESADFPTKPILQSMVGELYKQYLNNNRWQIQNRTNVKDNGSDDIQTWSMEQLITKSNELYRASLTDQKTKQTAIEDFNAILENADSSTTLRPTLYDFLAHRAIDHFSNEQSYLTEPVYTFNITQEAALGDISTFINTTFETKDSTSSKYQTLLIFQDVLAFHQQNKNTAALIDANLKRLDFVRRTAVFGDKDALYLTALEALANKHKDNQAWAEIQYKIAEYYQNIGNQYQPNPDDDKRWELKKAMEIAQKAVDAYPNSYGAKQCRSLKNNILTKNLNLTLEEVNVRNKPFLGLVQYKNVSTIFIKVIPFGEKEKDKLNRADYDKKLEYMNSLKPIKTWTQALPDDQGDYQNHAVEIKIDALSTGHYLVMASDNEQFTETNNRVAYMFTHVSNLAYLNRNNQGQTEIVIVDRVSGKAIKGAKAEFFKQEYNQKSRKSEYKSAGSAISNADGFVYPKLNDNKYYKVHISKGDDYLHLDNGFSNRYYDRQNRVRTTTHFFLDRAIYRPGQTVFFKGLVLEIDKENMPRILANKKVTVTFKDTNNQNVEELELVTNEFGTVNGSFTAPNNGLLGSMRITSSENGSKYFKVEEYKRPKFETTFKPVEGSFSLGDKVTVTGHAKAFAGNNIDGATVKYRVMRSVRYPYLPYWYYRYYRPSAPMQITTGTATTKADGTFDIEFELKPDPSISNDRKPTFTYQVYADVTDITGETQSAQTSVRAGTVALDVSINVPERIEKNQVDSFAILTQNLSGQFEAVKGKITIDWLQTPTVAYRKRLWSKPDLYSMDKATFNTAFPYDAYKNEDEVQNWKTVKTVVAENFNTAERRSIRFGKKTWLPGKYRLRLTTQDKNGTPIEIEQFFTIYDLNRDALAVGEMSVLMTDKNSYQPQETAKVHFGSADRSVHVLLDIFKKGQTSKAKWHAVRNLKTFDIPVTEKDRGNFAVATTFVKNNRVYTESQTITVPWTNKELNIEYSTFRDKLYPGQEEEWQVKISGHKKDKVAAEMLATMYDASLDQFAKNNWTLNLFPRNQYQRITWQNAGFGTTRSNHFEKDWSTSYNYSIRTYYRLNWFDFPFYESAFYGDNILLESVVVGDGRGIRKKSRSRNAPEVAMASPMVKEEAEFTIEVFNQGSVAADDALEFEGDISIEPPRTAEPPAPPELNVNETDFSDVKIRTNLNETVFFFPNLYTDENGDIIIKFTMKEALTKWKFMSLAHTKDLQFATTEKEIITQKDLMVVPNAPRFFREGDDIQFTAKVSNLTKNALSGTAVLQLFDAITMLPIDDILNNDKATVRFNTEAGQSDQLTWNIKIPFGKTQAVTHRVIAKAGDFSDGEENTLPVLTNRMLVTETMPIPVRGGEQKNVTFEGMLAKNSSTLRHHNFTLEFTSNPAWYAVQALPYLMEYPYECTEQIFSRLYANSLATSVANQHPKIKRVFEQWKGTDAMLSNLSKNQELKTALLEETPWVLDAQSEEQQKKRIGLLFDLNKMSRELEVAIKKIKERQLSNGGFSWFPGGRDNPYITQYLVEGIGHLIKLGVLDNIDKKLSNQLISISQKAVEYTDARMVEIYEEMQKRGTDMEKDHLNPLAIHYLYARSFFLDHTQFKGVKMEAPTPKYSMNKKALEVYNYYLGQAEKYWLKKGIYQEGMLALAMHRTGDTVMSEKIIRSLKEQSLNNEEMGMYWKYNTGYYWYQLPIETHALMIEAFAEIGDDPKDVDDLKVWLLKNKQTTNWKTTKATSAAVYALLSNGDNWLLDDQLVEISMGNPTLDQQIKQAQSKAEAGTGYFKTAWRDESISNDMATIEVNNPNNVVAWGAAYWQYFEDLDKITSFEDTPLKLNKKVFKVQTTDRGEELVLVNDNSTIEVGDKLKIRIELRVDRIMEYVHMKDMRASGLEPINVLSQYKWQDGLGYYESTKDASTNFFFSYLPKGTYVFEYPLWVAHEGDFSNGITTIQSMYAPEFTSHSEGIRLIVE